MSIEANIAVRKSAEELIELGESLVREGRLNLRRFWTVVEVMAAERAGHSEETTAPTVPVKPPPMAREEARRFDQQTLDFGQYRGRKIKDVPLEYLYWLHAANSRLYTDLGRYLNSEHVQAEMVKDPDE